MRMEKWAYTRVRWGQVRGRRAYLVVHMSPDFILGVVVLESLYAIDANVEICGVQNCHYHVSSVEHGDLRIATYGLQL